MAALVGGGTRPRPGEVSLAHLGVLFLDELPEFQPGVLDALRQPLETGETVIARANHRIAYPSRIQLVAAMNPCKCGGAEPGHRAASAARAAPPTTRRASPARCSTASICRSRCRRVSAADLVLPAPSEGSARGARARGAGARAPARARFAALGAAQRAHQQRMLRAQLLEEIATPDAEGAALLRQAADALHLSARGFHRTLRVARTLADLDGAESVGRMHIAEALSYRGETLRQSAGCVARPPAPASPSASAPPRPCSSRGRRSSSARRRPAPA